MTLSTNKIRNYTAYYEMYDNMNDWNYLGQHQVEFENTDILMSPSLVGMASMTVRPFVSSAGSLNSAYLTWNGKYVGKQYYDNTMSDDRSIPSYFTADLSVGYEVPVGRHPEHSEGSLGLYNLLSIAMIRKAERFFGRFIPRRRRHTPCHFVTFPSQGDPLDAKF